MSPAAATEDVMFLPISNDHANSPVSLSTA